MPNLSSGTLNIVMRFFSPLALALSLASWPAAVIADECQPVTWDPTKKARRADEPTGAFVVARPVPTMLNKREGPIQPGEINCRQWARTYDDVNYYTCYQLAKKYDITTDQFFFLNPDLQKDCSNVQPNAMYCVFGCKWATDRLGQYFSDTHHISCPCY